MFYYSVPAMIRDDPHELMSWAESAFAAAKRDKQEKRRT
tara:strand:- start:184 stop:300 length:117 start_codon:yes stop_codon:yes gene_type:complete